MKCLEVETKALQDEILIRRCRPQDIQPLKNLAAETAYFGQPCDFFFPDRDLLAALIMEYYARYEPEHTWVAEYNGQIIGYLSAGFYERRCIFYSIFCIMPRVLFKAILRNKMCNRKTLRLIFYNLRCFLSRQANLASVDSGKYPVHIHQNVKSGFRGRKIGARLLDAFLEYVDRKNVGVRFRALRQEKHFKFFERYGFRQHDCKRVPVWEEWLHKTPLYFMEYIRDSKS